MPCLVALLAILSPRLAILFVALFTNRFAIAFDHWWMPTLGFFVLPWTTLAWVVVYQLPWGVVGFGWFVVVLGFVIDLSSYLSAGARRARSS